MAGSLTLYFEDENMTRILIMITPMLNLLCKVSSSLHIGISVLDVSQLASIIAFCLLAFLSTISTAYVIYHFLLCCATMAY